MFRYTRFPASIRRDQGGFTIIAVTARSARQQWNRRALALGVLIVQVGVVSAAYAGDPTDQIRQRVGRVFHLLGAASSGETPTERDTAVRKIVDEMFDWTEMAKRALGRHWAQRTPAEQEKFVQLFASVFERATS
ncbi:MAG: ABC transporter substrate-binding protein [Candidatus Rokubacteria bacterium]|nr:ABC transporter substrate-binding protein [Candidatus Rokubacteria bacterium]